MRLDRLPTVAAVLFVLSACRAGDGPAPSPTFAVCTPGTSEACTCVAGRIGVRSCSAAGDAWGACACTGCGGVPLAASGAVYTSAATIPLADAPANAFLEFAGAQGTCLAHALLSVESASGCALDVEFGTGDGAYGGVRSVVLRVGPECPGFTLDQEGTYRSGPGWGAAWWTGPATRAPAAACAEEVSFGFPDAPMRLSRDDGAFLDVNLRDLTFAGDVALLGVDSPFLACVEQACSPETHDGGGGWCVPAGTCAGGFHDGGRGTCLVEGSCELGYGLDAEGACLAWRATGPMIGARHDHAAFRLPSGEVLVAGGYGSGYSSYLLTSTELYDPAAGTWRAGASTTNLHEHGVAWVQLADGRILATGGYRYPGGTTIAEAYAPPATPGGTGAWGALAGMTAGRYSHAATRLGDGRVLVTGGSAQSGDPLASAEIFSPATGQWTATGSMLAPRYAHGAVLLGDGRVLVFGGYGTGYAAATSAELYDPVSGTFTAAGAPPRSLLGALATALPDGRALVAVGDYWNATAMTFDPASGAFSQGTALPFSYPVAVAPLANGDVLVLANEGAALVEPGAALLVHEVPPPLDPRYDASATLLEDGTVLVAGGSADPSARSCERYFGGRR